MSELKPCPFCGSEASVVTDAPEYFVVCVNSRCSLTHSDKAIAIDRWNTRTPDKEAAWEYFLAGYRTAKKPLTCYAEALLGCLDDKFQQYWQSKHGGSDES